MFDYIKNGKLKLADITDYYADFITRVQLTDEKSWDRFVQVFKDKSDCDDGGWRCEFWGKMMRGACLTYSYSADEKLYAVLTRAVEGLLKTQDAEGRITTYSKEVEFRAWDMWGRKYVISGLLYYYGICKDEVLKERVLNALKAHADYILSKVGDGEGKIAITDTSNAWGNINACSILEPMINLYKVTGEKRYLDFGKYIISTGGCKDFNLIKYAEEGALLPYQYPVTKAYEMMSFFEGLLEYYSVTGEKRYLDVVCKFIEAVNSTDITIVGGTGCTHELFDNSAARQTEETDGIMQETCVTVTWIRVLSKLLMITGDVKYADRIEKSGYNLLFGSVNIYDRKQMSVGESKYVNGLPFDSYSPLVNSIRGRAIGGFRRFDENSFYGCCGCIGSAGTALMPLDAVMTSDKGVVINYYAKGVAEIDAPVKAQIKILSDYPVSGKAVITVCVDKPTAFEIKLRVPDWCDNCTIIADGKTVKAGKGYYSIEKIWKDGDIVSVDMEMTLKEHKLNGKSAYTYGALTLCYDEEKREDVKEKGELFRTFVIRNGKRILLTDYQSCGKRWNEDNDKVSVRLDGDLYRVNPDKNVKKISVWLD